MTNTAHRELLPCFRGAPRSGEGYKKLALRALKKCKRKKILDFSPSANASGVDRWFATLQDDKHRKAVILSKAKNLITLRTGNCSPVLGELRTAVRGTRS